MHRILLPIALAASSAPAFASGIPDDGVLDFAILRNGEQIGRHVFRFERRGDPTIVRIVAEVDYRIAFIPFYIFRHSASETWRGGKLVAMSAQTNDNGDDYTVALAEDGGEGELSVNDETVSVALPLRPASLWSNAQLGAQKLLDPADGEVMSVSVAAAGEDTISVRDRTIKAFRYEMTGDFQRCLWFDEDNVLVQVLFAGEDGSEIRYRLR